MAPRLYESSRAETWLTVYRPPYIRNLFAASWNSKKLLTFENFGRKFENVMNNTDLIYDFYIYKFNNENNFYKIIFNSSPDRFLEIMKNKNYEFDIQDQIWVLK